MTRPAAGRAVPHVPHVPHNDIAKRLLTPAEAAQYIRKPKGTMSNWRGKGYGPRFVKCGHSVRYDPADLEAFIDAQRRDPKA